MHHSPMLAPLGESLALTCSPLSLGPCAAGSKSAFHLVPSFSLDSFPSFAPASAGLGAYAGAALPCAPQFAAHHVSLGAEDEFEEYAGPSSAAGMLLPDEDPLVDYLLPSEQPRAVEQEQDAERERPELHLLRMLPRKAHEQNMTTTMEEEGGSDVEMEPLPQPQPQQQQKQASIPVASRMPVQASIMPRAVSEGCEVAHQAVVLQAASTVPASVVVLASPIKMSPVASKPCGSLSRFRPTPPVPVLAMPVRAVAIEAPRLTHCSSEPAATSITPQTGSGESAASKLGVTLRLLEDENALGHGFGSCATPSTPVPVGRQWASLSRQSKLHAHCVARLAHVDEAREAVLARLGLLCRLAGEVGALQAQHVPLLLQHVEHRFASARVQLTQLFLDRAKRQCVAEDAMRAAGISIQEVETEDVLLQHAADEEVARVSARNASPNPAAGTAVALAVGAPDLASASAAASHPSPSMPVLEQLSPSLTARSSVSLSSNSTAIAGASQALTLDTVATGTGMEMEPAPVTPKKKSHSPLELPRAASVLARVNEDEETGAAEDAVEREVALVAQAQPESSLMGRMPPPCMRRSQSAVFRPSPAASACRRLRFERESARCTSAAPIPRGSELSSLAPSPSPRGTPSPSTAKMGGRSRQLVSNAPLLRWFHENLDGQKRTM